MLSAAINTRWTFWVAVNHLDFGVQSEFGPTQIAIYFTRNRRMNTMNTSCSLILYNYFLWVIPTPTHYSDWKYIYIYIYGIYIYIYSILFWDSIWRSFWHLLWHSIWHLFWHTFYSLSGILSGIHYDILSGIFSGIHSDILSGILSDVPSSVWLRSGSAHWDLALAVEGAAGGEEGE